MTYDARETGAQTGEPVELYEFAHGPNFYRYTSADRDVVFESKTFTAVPLSRSAIEATQEIARGALTLTCARTLPLLSLFNPVPPSEVITAVVRRFHRGDTEAVVIWMGRVLNVGWAGLEAQIRCESVYSSIKRPGLRRMYQKQCPHVLYSQQCGVDREDWKVTAEVLSVSGLSVTLDSLTGNFGGGYIEWQPQPGIIERRAIRSNSGAVLSINFQAIGLTVGASVDVFPGCDHSLGAGGCAGYGNEPNYGGFPFIPIKNPFSGTPIY
jgi:uncharacterized phage protein (TIGR02218 family)